MNTRVLKVDPQHPAPYTMLEAANILRAGGLVAFPTETVYGLGANALSAVAIDRIFAAKGRPANDPIIAHIYEVSQIDLLAVDVPEVAFVLAEAFWPGPLTLILQRAASVPANIAAGLDTIAVRMPAHPVSRALLKAVGLPIAAPSANTFTRPSATTAAHVLEDLEGKIDLVLDGGGTTIGLESTVLDLTNTPPTVLRPGGVVIDALHALIPDVTLAPRYLTGQDAAASPGQMLKHYAPHAQMVVFTGERKAVLRAMLDTVDEYTAQGRRVGVLAAEEERGLFEGTAQVESLGSRDDLAAISRRLFAALRQLDSQRVDVILVRDYGREGLGAALWDRMLRAAEGHIVTVV